MMYIYVACRKFRVRMIKFLFRVLVRFRVARENLVGEGYLVGFKFIRNFMFFKWSDGVDGRSIFRILV